MIRFYRHSNADFGYAQDFYLVVQFRNTRAYVWLRLPADRHTLFNRSLYCFSVRKVERP